MRKLKNNVILIGIEIANDVPNKSKIIEEIKATITNSFSNYKIFDFNKYSNLNNLNVSLWKYAKKTDYSRAFVFFLNIKILDLFFNEICELNDEFCDENGRRKKYFIFNDELMKQYDTCQYKLNYEINHLLVVNNKNNVNKSDEVSYLYQHFLDKIIHIINFNKVYLYDFEDMKRNAILEKFFTLLRNHH